MFWCFGVLGFWVLGLGLNDLARLSLRASVPLVQKKKPSLAKEVEKHVKFDL